MGQYSKAIVAAVGLLVVIGKDILGVTIPQSTADQLSDGIIALLTIISVVQVRNG